MDFYTSHFMPLLGTFIFVMARLSGAFVTVPFLSSKLISTRLRSAIIFMLSFIMVPSVQKLNIDLMSFSAVLVLAVQFVIGAILGFVFYMSLQIFMLAGEMISMQAGLNMAIMNDPSSDVSVPIVSQIYYMIATLLFFVLDLPLQIINLLFKSFKTLPITTELLPRANFEELALMGGFFYKMAFQISLPIVSILFLVQITMGIMTKSAPQFNIFSVGFSITMLLAILMIWGNLNSVQAHFESITHYAFSFVSDIYRVSS